MKQLSSGLFKGLALFSLAAFLYTYIHSSFPNSNYVDLDDYFFELDEDRHSQAAYVPALLHLGPLTIETPGFERFKLLPTGTAMWFSEWVSRKTCRGPPISPAPAQS